VCAQKWAFKSQRPPSLAFDIFQIFSSFKTVLKQKNLISWGFVF